MSIREEEYAVLAFAIESIVSELLIVNPRLGAPRVYLIDGDPDLGAGREDLVYWWHLSATKFVHLENRARIDLLKAGDERECFDRRKFRDLGLEIATMDHIDLPNAAKWKFTLSRAGLDRANRQAVAHVWAEPGCNAEYAGGSVLVMGWDEGDGTLHVLERVVTGKPA